MGLILCKVEVPYRRNHYYFCSEFVSEILAYSQAIELPKLPLSLIHILLGQMMTSLVLENKGWLATSIRKLNIGKIIGLAVVCLGIGVMLL